MVIEFIGLPGVGKTTLKGALLDKERKLIDQRLVCLLPFFSLTVIEKIQFFFLKKNGNLRNLGRLLLLPFKYRMLERTKLYNNPISFFIDKDFNLSIHKNEIDFSKLIMVMESYAAFSIADGFRDVPFVFDEGPSQRGITLVRGTDSIEKIANYYLQAPKPDLLVIVEASDEIIDGRILIRNGNESSLKDMKDISRRAIDICAKTYEEAGVNIISIDGERPLKSNLSIIDKSIEALFNDK